MQQIKSTLDPKCTLLLGSKSPRRRTLLESLKIPFSCVTIDCDEIFPELPPQEVAVYLSHKKSLAYTADLNNATLITSDTTVISQNTVLNKPENIEEARLMLHQLSNATHQVITGVTIRNEDQTLTLGETTEVTMDHISTSEIEFYIQNFQPFDKAGGYGIQEWLGLAKIKSIHGCYYNVMGLPTNAIYNHLKKMELI